LVSQNDRLALVEELYVDPAARGVGLGEMLLDACTAWASDLGCTGIDVEVQPGNRSAKNACERSGFKARALTMHRSLGSFDEEDEGDQTVSRPESPKPEA
jgi:GNAT superfamily N-acetyltransferase